jgi:hypothetical protein
MRCNVESLFDSAMELRGEWGMTNAHDLAAKFSSHGLDKAQVQRFATAISEIEREAGVIVTDVNTKGTPPFWDIPGVDFHKVPGDRLTKLLDAVLKHAELNKNVLINGIPAPGHYNVTVLGGR